MNISFCTVCGRELHSDLPAVGMVICDRCEERESDDALAEQFYELEDMGEFDD